MIFKLRICKQKYFLFHHIFYYWNNIFYTNFWILRPFTFWKYDQFIFVSIQYIICLRSIRKVKFKLHSRKICLRSIRKVKLKLHFRAICLGSIRKVKLKLHFRMTDQKGKYFLDSNSRRLHTKFIPRYSVSHAQVWNRVLSWE